MKQQKRVSDQQAFTIWNALMEWPDDEKDPSDYGGTEMLNLRIQAMIAKPGPDYRQHGPELTTLPKKTGNIFYLHSSWTKSKSRKPVRAYEGHFTRNVKKKGRKSLFTLEGLKLRSSQTETWTKFLQSLFGKLCYPVGYPISKSPIMIGTHLPISMLKQ